MKHLFFITLILATSTAFAQPLKSKLSAKFNTSHASDSVSLNSGGKVYVYQEQSEKIRFMGQLALVNAEFSPSDILKWGYGASADVFLKKYLSFHAEFASDYIDIQKTLSRNDNQTNYNLNDVTGGRTAEAGIRVFLKDERTRLKHRIILESHTHYRTTIEYYIKPELPCRHIIALRGGYFQNTSIVTTDMASGSIIKTKDGMTLGSTYFTNAHTSGAYIGIANLVFFSAVTKNTYKKGSVFQSRAVNELYLDVLVASTKFDGMRDTLGTHTIVANDPGSFQTSPIGARIGYKCNKENRGIGSYKIELGYRPGLSGSGLYLNIGFSLALIK